MEETTDGFKILINRLPPHLEEEQFYNTLQSFYIYNFNHIEKYFVTGYYPANPYESPRFTRAYIKFDTYDRLNSFLAKLDEKFVFSDDRMKDLQPLVKPCPEFPEMPEDCELQVRKVSDGLDNNELYKAFLRNENDFQLSESNTIYSVEDVTAALTSCSASLEYESFINSLTQDNSDKKSKPKKAKVSAISKKVCNDFDEVSADSKTSKGEKSTNNSSDKDFKIQSKHEISKVQVTEKLGNSKKTNLLNHQIEIASASSLATPERNDANAVKISSTSKKEKSKKKSKKSKSKKTAEKNQSNNELDDKININNKEKAAKSKPKTKNKDSITEMSTFSSVISKEEIIIVKAEKEPKSSKKKTKRSNKESSPNISVVHKDKSKSKTEKVTEASKSEEVKEKSEKNNNNSEQSKEKKKKKKDSKKKKQEIPVPGPSGAIEVLQRKIT